MAVGLEENQTVSISVFLYNKNTKFMTSSFNSFYTIGSAVIFISRELQYVMRYVICKILHATYKHFISFSHHRKTHRVRRVVEPAKLNPSYNLEVRTYLRRLSVLKTPHMSKILAWFETSFVSTTNSNLTGSTVF